MKGKKLFIGIANSEQSIHSAFFWSFIQIRRTCETVIFRASHADSNLRNNNLLNSFLESGTDYYIQMDTDQIYPPDYLEKMVPLIEEYSVIAPVIYDRWQSNRFFPLAYSCLDPETLGFKGSKVLDIKGKTGVEEVAWTHTNLFMKREVVEKLPKPIFNLYFTEDGLSKWKHTDHAVNEKIKNAGYKIYMNFDVVVKHIASVPVDAEVYERWKP